MTIKRVFVLATDDDGEFAKEAYEILSSQNKANLTYYPLDEDKLGALHRFGLNDNDVIVFIITPDFLSAAQSQMSIPISEILKPNLVLFLAEKLVKDLFKTFNSERIWIGSPGISEIAQREGRKVFPLCNATDYQKMIEAMTEKGTISILSNR